MSTKNKVGFYAVHKGYQTGVFDSWKKAEKYIKGYPNAVYKKFNDLESAKQYAKHGKITKESESTRSSKSSGIISIGSDSTVKVIKPMYLIRVEVWTDGSCINNGKSGAKGGIGVYFGKDHPDNVSRKCEGHPTNQRAELQALIAAMEILQHKVSKNKTIVIYTDSEYSIKCITQWSSEWSKNDWIKSNGTLVKNKSLVKRCYQLYKIVKPRLVHINSHQNPPKDKRSKEYRLWKGNDRADRLAVLGANS